MSIEYNIPDGEERDLDDLVHEQEIHGENEDPDDLVHSRIVPGKQEDPDDVVHRTPTIEDEDLLKEEEQQPPKENLD